MLVVWPSTLDGSAMHPEEKRTRACLTRSRSAHAAIRVSELLTDVTGATAVRSPQTFELGLIDFWAKRYSKAKTPEVMLAARRELR